MPEKHAVTAANLPSWPSRQDVRHHLVSQTESHLTYIHNQEKQHLKSEVLKQFSAILNQEIRIKNLTSN